MRTAISRTALRAMLLTLGMMILSAVNQHALAATLYWDANGAGAGTGGTGNWGSSEGSIWRDGSTVGTLQAWVDNNDVNLPATAGTITLADNVTVGQNGTSTIISGTSGYTINGDGGGLYSLTFDATGGGGAYRISTNAGNLTINAPVILTGYDQNPRGNVTFNGNISETGGSYGIVKNLVGTTMALNGNNSFSGGVSLSQGSLIVGHDSALGTGSFSWGSGTTLTAGGGDRIIAKTLLNTWNQAHTIAGSNNFTFSNEYRAMSAFGTSAFFTLNIVESDAEATFNNFTTLTSGSNGGFKKLGAGTMILDGTFTPNTLAMTIEGGTMLVNTVAGATTGVGYNVTTGTLGGTGTINLGAGASVDVDAGGTIAPGASVGTLTVNGDVIIDGTLANEISGSSTDLLAITGNLTLGGGSVLSIIGTPDGVTDYTIATFTGTLTGTFDTINGLDGYLIEYGANSISLAVVPVPEPSTGAMFLIGMIGQMLRRRRRLV